MGRKKRHGHPGFKFGKYLNLAFKIMGGVAVASPGIRAAKDTLLAGDVDGFAPAIVSNYTGINTRTGGFDMAQATAGIGSVFGGVFIAKLGGWLARRF